MKINILLPYKEQYSNLYSGAVSIFVKDNIKHSIYKKNINVFGVENNFNEQTNSKNKYISILKTKFLRNYLYVKKFANLIKNEISIVELHNRPNYFPYLKKKLPDNNYILYLHNNPLELKGSRSIVEREYILNNCKYIIFLSEWIKNKFFSGIDIKKYNNFSVIYPGVSKIKKIPKKKNIIFFSGKLNSSKGYNLFCEATKEFIQKNKDWKIISAGTETRRDINIYDHVKELGQISHNKVLEYIKKSKITIAPSKWEEPLGRLPIESAANGSVCISSSNGGLIESNKYGIIIKNINKNKIIKSLNFLKIEKHYKILQYRVFNNHKLTSEYSALKIDKVRNKFIIKHSKNLFKKNLKIFHISNFNDNTNGRLFYSTQRKINLGLVKLGHNIFSLDEKLFFRKNFILFKKLEFNNKVLEINKNYVPDLIIIGHINSILPETFLQIKKINPNVIIIRIYIDSISKEFFKYNSQILLNNFKFIDRIFITSKPNNMLNKFKSKISFIPNMVDSSIETLKNFNNDNFEYDLFFALSHGQNRGKFKKGFSDERDNFIKILNSKTTFLKKYFISTNFNEPLWGNDYYNLLSKCQMGLNISRGSYQDFYSSDRISSLFGNGLLVFLEAKTKLHKFFSNNEAIFFNNINDLIKKLKYYKNNPSKSRIIAKNGYLKYHKYFSNIQVCNYILQKTNLIKKNKKFIWESI